MSFENLGGIFINAALINNFVLAYFLGICPFLGVSGNYATASRMGGAVTFVMLVSSMCAFGIHALLVAVDAQFLQLISFIVVIASTVQTVEMIIKKFSPALFRSLGIFLPLITTNCAILGLALFQTNKGYGFVECLFYALGAGAGFTIAIVLMAGLREHLDLADVPSVVRGAALTLMLAGILSLTFTGFAGLGAEDVLGELYPFVVATGGILGMSALWIAVQRAWGRAFDMADQDVLALRGGCGGCVRRNACRRAGTCQGDVETHIPASPPTGLPREDDET